MSAARSSQEGLFLLELTRSSETDSWLIYLSCRQGGGWYTDLAKGSKGFSYVSLLGVISAWFSSPSVPSLCFTSSLIPAEPILHTPLPLLKLHHWKVNRHISVEWWMHRVLNRAAFTSRFSSPYNVLIIFPAEIKLCAVSSCKEVIHIPYINGSQSWSH